MTRFRATRLLCKTHHGLGEVACIEACHPTHVSFTVAKTGQRGYHHKTEMNKKVYKIKKVGEETNKAAN